MSRNQILLIISVSDATKELKLSGSSAWVKGEGESVRVSDREKERERAKAFVNFTLGSTTKKAKEIVILLTLYLLYHSWHEYEKRSSNLLYVS